MKKQIAGAAFITAIMLVTSGATAQIITTVAGNGAGGYSGDGGSASVAQLSPNGIAVDGAGNMYILDKYRVRKVNTSGIISTIAGNGLSGYSGDGGAATAAQLNDDLVSGTGDDSGGGIAVDGSGNVYIADYYNNAIRKINTSGTISTVAGKGPSFSGVSGDGGAATTAELYRPSGIAIDGSGNLYIADYGNERIRKVNSAGIISTVAGTGIGVFSGDGGAATAAVLSKPQAVAIDGSGNLYIADQGNGRIRKVNSSGIISTIAGNGGSSFTDGGAATATMVDPYGVATDGTGNVYIAETYNDVIREVNTSGIISTVAGHYGSPFELLGDGGPATAACLWFPNGVAIDSHSNMYISEGAEIRFVNTGTAIVNSMPSLFSTIEVYPNPAHNSIQIQTLQFKNTTAEVYNMEGQKVITRLLPGYSTSIDVTTISSGVYLVKLVNAVDGIIYQGKIVKE